MLHKDLSTSSIQLDSFNVDPTDMFNQGMPGTTNMSLW